MDSSTCGSIDDGPPLVHVAMDSSTRSSTDHGPPPFQDWDALLIHLKAILSRRHADLKRHLDAWMAHETDVLCLAIEQQRAWHPRFHDSSTSAARFPGDWEVTKSGIDGQMITLDLDDHDFCDAALAADLVETAVKNLEEEIPAEYSDKPINSPRVSVARGAVSGEGKHVSRITAKDNTRNHVTKEPAVSFVFRTSTLTSAGGVESESAATVQEKSTQPDRSHRSSEMAATRSSYNKGGVKAQKTRSSASAKERFSEGPHVQKVMTTFTEADNYRRSIADNFAHTTMFDKSTTLATNVGKGIRARAHAIKENKYFELFFGIIIIVNSLLLGVQLEVMSHMRADLSDEEDPDQTEPVQFFAIQNIFAFCFLAEVTIRLTADGGRFFCSLWNYLDLFVVISSAIELALDILTMATQNEQNEGLETVGNIRIMRMLRITRLARVIRVIKIVRFVYSLRTLITSIVCTLRSLFWAMCLLTMIIYLWAMVLAQFSHNHLQKEKGSADLDFYWGSLSKSMFTLFKSVSGGVSWEECIKPLEEVNHFCVFLFTVYVIFTYFAVLNVVTGVFCQSAIESAERDYDLVVQSNLQDKEYYTEKLRKLFNEIDDDDNKQIDIKEFERHLGDEQVQAYLTSLELHSSDIWRLFKLLDVNESQELDLEEFLAGCFRLRGPAKAIEMAEVMHEMRHTRKRLFSFMSTVDSMLTAIVNSMDIAYWEDDDERLEHMNASWTTDSLDQSPEEYYRRRTQSKFTQDSRSNRSTRSTAFRPSTRSTAFKTNGSRGVSKVSTHSGRSVGQSFAVAQMSSRTADNFRSPSTVSKSAKHQQKSLAEVLDALQPDASRSVAPSISYAAIKTGETVTTHRAVLAKGATYTTVPTGASDTSVQSRATGGSSTEVQSRADRDD